FTPQISMMAMMAPVGARSGIARYAPISPSRSFTLMFSVFMRGPQPPSHCERSEAISLHLRMRILPRLLRRFAPRNDETSQPHQLARIGGKDLSALGSREIQRVHGRDGVPDRAAAVLGAERRVGREQAVRGLEESVAAARGRDLAVERGVGVEHLVISARMQLEPGFLGGGVALGRAEEDLPETEV